MKYEGKSFLEAAESLARDLNIEIPQSSAGDKQARGLRSQMLQANHLATDFFCSALAKSPQATSYLQERGISPATQERFRLGYAPAEWGQLATHLPQVGVPLEIAAQVGLLLHQKNRRGYYDRFRDRLICPLINLSGDIVGFSGRQLEGGEHSGAKYINSPESVLYKKSKLLFGLRQARDGVHQRGRVLLVEGNFDVLSLHEAGFTETLAPLGTALTREQAEILRRLTPSVILLYDGDRAGRAAAFKSLGILSAVDLEVRIAVLPEGEDPDTIARAGGKKMLAPLIDNARPAFEYFFYEVWGQSQLNTDSKARVVDQVTKMVAQLKNPTKRDLVVGMLTSALSIDEKLVRRAVKRHQQHLPSPPQAPPTSATPLPKSSQPIDLKTPDTFEIDILALLFDHPQLLPAAEQKQIFSLLTHPLLRDMYSAARGGENMLSALSRINSQETAQTPPDKIMSSKLAKRLLAESYAAVAQPEQTLHQIVSRLENTRKQEELKQLHQQGNDARRRGDRERERQLNHQIIQTLKALENRSA